MGNPRFASILTRSRLRAGITQQQLADLSTVSSRAIRNLEKGLVDRPRHETVRLLADALRLDGRTRNALLEFAAERPAAAADGGQERMDPHDPRDPVPESTAFPESRRPQGPPESRPRYEYRAVPVGSGRTGSAEQIVEVLNRAADSGWRLAALETGTAILERRRPVPLPQHTAAPHAPAPAPAPAPARTTPDRRRPGDARTTDEDVHRRHQERPA